MNTTHLYSLYQEALETVRRLREQAGYAEPEGDDSTQLRREARRFARSLSCVPDAATAEIDLLADHAGAQAFWQLLNANWETMELMIIPSAFELLPNPMPFEVLSVCFLSMLDTEPEVASGRFNGASAGGEVTFEPSGASGWDALRLSPWVGQGKVGAVWEFADVY